MVALFCCLLPAFSITGEHPVLIISSYNPDAGRTSGNISDFMEEFQRLGGTNTIALENMNCKSFSESPLWERRMAELLAKYQGDKSPALIVLIGQEAWAAYLSLEDSICGNTPVVSALSSRNAILLPGDTVDLKTWMPESVDFFTDFPSSPIKAGFVYEYDVEANINMIKQMYPGTKNIAFVSDNSYGGVAMQAYVVKEMQKFPELNLILLDGRVHTIYTICDRLHELPENTAILMGTWRVDMNDGYFMRNATYAMMEAAPTLPTFSLSSVGLGYWAVAGVVPAYRALGKEMARQSYRLLTTPQDSETHMEIIPNETILDGKLVKEKKLNITGLPQPVKMLNVTPSFYEQYKYHIWSVGAVLLVLLGGLFVSLYFYYHTKKLKDELEVSEGALREAKDRADIIITTGGLGPTLDDLTKETLATVFGKKMVLHQPSMDRLTDFFKTIGREMTKNNEKQAWLPEGCTVFTNLWGTAPGCAFEADGKHVLMLPGPPRECNPMWKECAMPYLYKLAGGCIVSRNIRVFGLGESNMENILHDMMEKSANPTIAPYARTSECFARVTAKADTPAECEKLLDPVVDEILKLLGDDVYGVDVDSLEQVVGDGLRERKLTLAVAESCTGGLLSKRLTDIPGASDYYLGGVCSYSNSVKEKVLGVKKETLDTVGAVSPETAEQMAVGVANALGSDIGVGITGIAGPGGGTEDKPTGLVYISVWYDGKFFTRKMQSSLGRDRVRMQAASTALDLIRRHIF